MKGSTNAKLRQQLNEETNTTVELLKIIERLKNQIEELKSKLTLLESTK